MDGGNKKARIVGGPFSSESVSVAEFGGYGWDRTTDLGIMSPWPLKYYQVTAIYMFHKMDRAGIGLMSR